MAKLRFYAARIMELGIKNTMVGFIKKAYYKRLMKRYGFDPWHLSPLEHRAYALGIAKYLSGGGLQEKATVVEIGCGLGDILRKIRKTNKRNRELRILGYDISPSVINAAREISKNDDIGYNTGSFDDVSGCKITYLITVNFIHGIEPGILAEYYNKIVKNNDVEFIIADMVLSANYEYNHNLTELMPDGYGLVYKSDMYQSQRYIMVFAKERK